MPHPLPKLLASLLLTATFATNAYAALESRLNGQAVYDTDINVTWLADGNLAAFNTFGVSGINLNGTMSWTTAQSWISAMNAADFLGYNNWELPTTLQPDASCGSQFSGFSGGYGCTGSMMGHLFYTEFGGHATSGLAPYVNDSNYRLFYGVQFSEYWSGTTWADNPSYAWNFNMGSGFQTNTDNTSPFYVWAVHPGDVAAVPEPETYAMFLTGLGLVGALARRRL